MLHYQGCGWAVTMALWYLECLTLRLISYHQWFIFSKQIMCLSVCERKRDRQTWGERSKGFICSINGSLIKPHLSPNSGYYILSFTVAHLCLKPGWNSGFWGHQVCTPAPFLWVYSRLQHPLSALSVIASISLPPSWNILKIHLGAVSLCILFVVVGWCLLSFLHQHYSRDMGEWKETILMPHSPSWTGS